MAITLNNGFKMPIIGLGVWRMEGKEIRDLIINAIKIGYRHFDCAGTFLYSCFQFLIVGLCLVIILTSSEVTSLVLGCIKSKWVLIQLG